MKHIKLFESHSRIKIEWVKWNEAWGRKDDAVRLNEDEKGLLKQMSENDKYEISLFENMCGFKITEIVDRGERSSYVWLVYKMENSFLKMNNRMFDGNTTDRRFYEYHTGDIREFFRNFVYDEDYGMK
jgi:hypothetical protein